MDARPARQNYFATLDLLRLAAAVAVVLYHYCFRGPAAGAPPQRIPPNKKGALRRPSPI